MRKSQFSPELEKAPDMDFSATCQREASMMNKRRILVVDDTAINIKIINELLKDEYHISIATNGPDALALISSENQPDLILLDIMMPGMDGYEVCKQIKQEESTSSIPVLFLTSMGQSEDETMGLEIGAVDYITKPINPPILLQRVRNHMALHLHHERLEELVSQRTEQLREGYIDTIHRLTLASEYKDEDTGAHIKRISHYSQELAKSIGMPEKFCDEIFYASPMHDIGKVAIPDAILLKKGPLDDAEWEVMKTHAEIGAKILSGSHSPFLEMAVEIAQCHHERWDGSGYPNKLSGQDIPLTARIMNIADQYDALRSIRPYKPAFDHQKTMSIILKGDGRTLPQHFDPDLLKAFENIADRFAEIFTKHSEL